MSTAVMGSNTRVPSSKNARNMGRVRSPPASRKVPTKTIRVNPERMIEIATIITGPTRPSSRMASRISRANASCIRANRSPA